MCLALSKPTVAILGSGNIGIDLAERILAMQEFSLVGVIGRRRDSPGLNRMSVAGVSIFPDGIDEFLSSGLKVDGFFDATSAMDHLRHWKKIENQTDSWVIDLTPSRVGREVIPVIDGDSISADTDRNLNMVTCGGQSSSPILHAMVESAKEILEVEVSSSIASDSAGPATRRNLDNYIDSTEATAQRISGVPAKVILVLNPSKPQVMMRTSVTVRAGQMNLETARGAVESMVSKVALSVPGYMLVLPPTEVSAGVFMTTVSVEGAGYYLPKYAGNLDIINAAALQTARILESVPQ